MLKSPRPPRETSPLDSADRKLLEAAQFLAAERFLIGPSVYRRRTLCLWGRARDLVLRLDRSRCAALLRDISGLINEGIAATEIEARMSTLSSRPGSTRARGAADRDWMDRLLRGAVRITEVESLGTTEETAPLLLRIKSGPLRQRKKPLSCWPIGEVSRSEQSPSTSR
jgi:hypothetical protein